MVTFKAPAIEIPDNDPFRYDSLSRRESADVLTQFISSIDEPFVLAIESNFGFGKTTFVKMWKKELTLRGLPVLYFNAWDTDFTGDPLISFVGEMASQIKSLGNASTTSQIISKAKDLARMIAKRSLPVAEKAGYRIAMNCP